MRCSVYGIACALLAQHKLSKTQTNYTVFQSSEHSFGYPKRTWTKYLHSHSQTVVPYSLHVLRVNTHNIPTSTCKSIARLCNESYAVQTFSSYVFTKQNIGIQNNLTQSHRTGPTSLICSRPFGLLAPTPSLASIRIYSLVYVFDENVLKTYIPTRTTNPYVFRYTTQQHETNPPSYLPHTGAKNGK